MPAVDISDFLFGYMFFISILLNASIGKPYLSGLKNKKLSCYKIRGWNIEGSRITKYVTIISLRTDGPLNICLPHLACWFVHSLALYEAKKNLPQFQPTDPEMERASVWEGRLILKMIALYPRGKHGFLSNWVELFHKSINGSGNGSRTIGPNWLGMKPQAWDKCLFIELVKDEHHLWSCQQISKYILVRWSKFSANGY